MKLGTSVTWGTRLGRLYLRLPWALKTLLFGVALWYVWRRLRRRLSL